MATPRLLVLTGWIAADSASTLETVAAIGLLAGALGAGIATFVWVRNWRRRLAEQPTVEEQIESFQHMLDEGLIEPQEYERIRGQLRQAPDVAADAAPDHPAPDHPATGIRGGAPPRPTDFRAGPSPTEPPPSPPPDN